MTAHVNTFRKPILDEFGNITRFTWLEGPKKYVHTPLSNFFIEKDYSSVENEFAASKTNDLGKKIEIFLADPPTAKKLGRKAPLRHDWEEVKFTVMRNLVFQKFFDDFQITKWLNSTGDAYLIEGNDWGDVTWGKCQGKGKNWLGLILMEVREEFRPFFN